jgi:preprotein translocase subunit SecB
MNLGFKNPTSPNVPFRIT